MKTRPDSLLSWLAALLPVAALFGVAACYIENIPWFDDFESFSGFLIEYLRADTWRDKFHWLFIPNNEHRIVAGKLLVLGVYYVSGELNYYWIQLLADFSVIGIWLLLWLAFRRLQLSLWYFVPVSLLLFHPQYYLLTFWAITGLQHQLVLLLVSLTAFCLAKGTWKWYAAAFFFAVLATFSMGNGMFVWAAGAGVLLLRKRFAQLVLWLAGMAGGMAGYFYHFATKANDDSLAKFFKMPHLSLAGFFTYNGGLLDLFPDLGEPWRYVLPTIGGLVLIVLVVRWLLVYVYPVIIRYKRPAEKNPFYTDFLLGILLFLLANSLLIAIMRPHFGYFVMLISNYRLYPILLTCLVYLGWLQRRRDTLPRPMGIVVASLVICLISYASYFPKVANRRALLLASVRNQYYSSIGLGATRGSFLEPYIDRTFREPMRTGIFHPPVHFFDAAVSRATEPEKHTVSIAGTEEMISVQQSTLPVPGGRDAFLLLRIKSETAADDFVIPFEPAANAGRNPFKRGVGGGAHFYRHMLRPGVYTLEIIQISGSAAKRYPTGQKLTI
ncbi:hypothetical protein [Siphonobacter aquaeclarae]|uniref:4-amino-4-deoxy-L-arabinose transferase n=1 Tax=Siphonobacter aquaeclarae TaxID=563176 RepID=A0A1G9QAC6_9BACT|nr:hypothetical protein [Siphonobacter aquaeclarae]SDM08032.1 hypothetical protein SAMN04488090_2541 [Siphonobacter aquaeclarae]